MQLSGRQRYGSVLAIIAIAILVLGYLLRPAPRHLQTRADDLTVTRAEMENLQQLVRRNNLRSLSANFVTSAEDASAHVSLVQPWATNAVLIPEGLIVAKRLDALPRQLQTASGSLLQPIAPGAWVPGLPFLLGRQQLAMELTPAQVGANTPPQGEWVLVVAHGDYGDMLLSPGVFDGVIQESCGPFLQTRIQTTIPLKDTHLGGGLFDLAGDLYGVVVPCDDGPAIVPIPEIRRGLAGAASGVAIVLARYGLRFATNAEGSKSTVVTEVWDDWPGDQAGIEPGDVLISIDGKPIAASQDAIAVLGSTGSGESDVRVRRGRQALTFHLNAMTLQNATGIRPALYSEDGTGIVVTRVPKGSSAEQAGVRASDRIVSIDGKPATKAIVDQTLGQFRVADSLALIVRRPGRRVQLMVQP